MKMYTTDYQLLIKQTEALIGGTPHFIANLANLSALIYQTLKEINWAGFYLAEERLTEDDPVEEGLTEEKPVEECPAAGELLVLGPFQGKTACIEIPFGKGVCGKAASEDRPVLVEDVHRFPGHIACDSASRSEIVIPFHRDGRVAGVLDIDSPVLARFTQEDLNGLSEVVKMLEQTL